MSTATVTVCRDFKREIKNAIREKYCFPGGYELVIVLSDGEILCMDCAKKNYKELAYAMQKIDTTGGWLPSAIGIIGHTIEAEDIQCVHCYKTFSDND